MIPDQTFLYYAEQVKVRKMTNITEILIDAASMTKKVACWCLFPSVCCFLFSFGMYRAPSQVILDIFDCVHRYKRCIEYAQRTCYRNLNTLQIDTLYVHAIRALNEIKTRHTGIRDFFLLDHRDGKHFIGYFYHTLLHRPCDIEPLMTPNELKAVYAALPLFMISVYTLDEYITLHLEQWAQIEKNVFEVM